MSAEGRHTRAEALLTRARALAVALAISLASGGDAVAGCLGPDNPAHTLDSDEAGVDTTPPGPIAEAAVAELVYSRKPRPWRCGGNDDICCDVGRLAIKVDDAADDRTPSIMMGYLVELVSGEIPAAFPDTPVQLVDGLLLHEWENDRDPLRATLSIRAVDLAGNVGPATLLEIDEAGGVGCHIADLEGSVASFMILGLGLCLARRRRAPLQPQTINSDGATASGGGDDHVGGALDSRPPSAHVK